MLSCKPVMTDKTTPDGTSINSINVQPGFTFGTAQDVQFQLKVLTNQDKPMAGVPLSVYGLPGEELLFSGITQADGLLTSQHSVGNQYTQLSIRTNFPGLPNNQTLDLSSTTVNFTIGGSKPTNYSGGRLAAGTAALAVTALPTLATLGTWNGDGVPSYLTTSDAIDGQFYQDIMVSLPENSPLPTSHPSYLLNQSPTTLSVKELADVWVTFVHEGAGWQNTLGFYTFDANTPPQSVADLKNLTVVFPNVSFVNSGGGLVSGNKVKIGRFPAGTNIGFFLIANAFSNGKIGDGYYAHFSHSNLNVEKSASIQRHVVLLDDNNSNRTLLAFEDVSRENTPINCDNDFNDAIFYLTSNPVTALDDPNLPNMDTGRDSDGDGASDSVDEYPTDSKRAFNSFTPAKATYGTLAYEDLWPSKGDYDFNDLILNYNFQEVLSASNKVVDVKGKLVVRSIASFHNGWGFELPVAASNVTNITGGRLRKTQTAIPMQIESAGSKGVIVAFDDVVGWVNRPTTTSGTSVVGDTLTLGFSLTTPVAAAQWSSPPYNSFLIVNQERGHEVHLVDKNPTAKMDMSLFGTLDDRSYPSKGVYYRSARLLPWALNLPVSFDYPLEKMPITSAYTKFGAWAESGGTLYKDWYVKKAGYRNDANIHN